MICLSLALTLHLALFRFIFHFWKPYIVYIENLGESKKKEL